MKKIFATLTIAILSAGVLCPASKAEADSFHGGLNFQEQASCNPSDSHEVNYCNSFKMIDASVLQGCKQQTKNKLTVKTGIFLAEAPSVTGRKEDQEPIQKKESAVTGQSGSHLVQRE